MNIAAARKISRLALLVLALPLGTAAQTSPEKFLGFKVGADRKLADYNQIRPTSRNSTRNPPGSSSSPSASPPSRSR